MVTLRESSTTLVATLTASVLKKMTLLAKEAAKSFLKPALKD